jgi:preprotein translocase subunit SecD
MAGPSATEQVSAASTEAARQRSGLWIGGIAFAPQDIASAQQGWETYSAIPNVAITFTETGRVKFAWAQQDMVGQPLEINIDGEVVSSPILREPILGNQVTITGGFTAEEAAALARRIAPPQRPTS